MMIYYQDPLRTKDNLASLKTITIVWVPPKAATETRLEKSNYFIWEVILGKIGREEGSKAEKGEKKQEKVCNQETYDGGNRG